MGVNEVVAQDLLKIDGEKSLPEDTKVIVLTPKM